jgi:4-diphosphocytidyl-2-C-methyl-D-erythritol kinase
VLGRRADGYHDLDSLVVFADVGDCLHAEPADELTFALRGPFRDALDNEPDNLVLKAARLFAASRGKAVCLRLVLDKQLPVASGLGGGSADAAATLRLLARQWGLDGAAAMLMRRLAPALGADVSACLVSRAARVGGIGERVARIEGLPACGIALLNPGIGLSTRDVFEARRGPFSAPATLDRRWPNVEVLAHNLSALSNDLEATAVALCPPIADVLAALRAQPGCLLARMSGSGPTCFGVFPSPATAAEAAASAVARRPGWWGWGGALRPVPPDL